jgi:hypothetical protein
MIAGTRLSGGPPIGPVFHVRPPDHPEDAVVAGVPGRGQVRWSPVDLDPRRLSLHNFPGMCPDGLVETVFFGFTALAWWAALVAIGVVIAMYLLRGWTGTCQPSLPTRAARDRCVS